jgi:hypothetical protein
VVNGIENKHCLVITRWIVDIEKSSSMDGNIFEFIIGLRMTVSKLEFKAFPRVLT